MANFISIFRMFLAAVVVALLFVTSSSVYWLCFFLTIIVIWFDGLDGYIARKFNETSKFGAVLNIGDRFVETI